LLFPIWIAALQAAYNDDRPAGEKINKNFWLSLFRECLIFSGMVLPELDYWICRNSELKSAIPGKFSGSSHRMEMTTDLLNELVVKKGKGSKNNYNPANLLSRRAKFHFSMRAAVAGGTL